MDTLLHTLKLLHLPAPTTHVHFPMVLTRDQTYTLPSMPPKCMVGVVTHIFLLSVFLENRSPQKHAQQKATNDGRLMTLILSPVNTFRLSDLVVPVQAD